MSLKKLDIPLGISADDKMVSIPIIFPHRNHCFITGAPGSGKSTLLKVIIDSIGEKYDKSQFAIWTDYFSHNYEKCPSDSIIEVCVPERGHEERMIALFDRLYEEAQNRLETISRIRVSSYSQVDSLPLLIAVIDDLFPLDYSDRGRYTTDKLWHVLRMSHAVGISLICSCQLPLSRLNGISAATEHLFNVRIVLRTFRDSIFEALDASPSTASVELKEAIDNLSFGRPGEFLYYNRYESESFISGRVTP